LSKLSEAKNHISVKVEMDEMDLTAAESKATYQEIQEWVQEKYGFHVSHLNIAKTKRKCGILERQNSNLPKSEVSRSPETPKEKEEAIIDAFASDEEAKVRLSFVWASENIAVNTPDIYAGHMPVFEKLLYDENDRVRMEAPEIFRVLGKRKPEFVTPYLETLRRISETDPDRVVRIHCAGALKAATGSR
jgi:3-methyladenine DNA glycosylase AlkD